MNFTKLKRDYPFLQGLSDFFTKGLLVVFAVLELGFPSSALTAFGWTYLIINRVILTAVVIYVVFIRKRRKREPPNAVLFSSERVWILITSALLYSSFLPAFKRLLPLLIIPCFAALLLFVIRRKFSDLPALLVYLLLVSGIIALFSPYENISIIDTAASNRVFWYGFLIGACLIAICVTVWLIRKKAFQKKLIGYIFLALLLGSVGGAIIACNLNFTLDIPAEGEQVRVEVLDKNMNIHRTRRSRRVTRKLQVTYGERIFWIRVHANTYEKTEIGDRLLLTVYDGTFGVPYMVRDELIRLIEP